MDRICLSDALQVAIDTLSELKRLHQLNFELLEQLNITCQWLIDNTSNIPNKEHLKSLLGKSLSLLEEMDSKTIKLMPYQKLADEKKQSPRTDEEGTVPHFSWCWGSIVGCIDLPCNQR